VHGGTKATRDTCRFLSEAGWKRLDTTCSGPKLLRILQLGRHLVALLCLPRRSIVLVQFPAYGVASRLLYRFILCRFNSVALIHDLERLRGKSLGSSEGTLSSAAAIIYTGKFETQLPQREIPSAILGAWDYWTEGAFRIPSWSQSGSIVFAGNLSRSKNGWLYEECSARPCLLLYGNHYQRDANPNSDRYRGEFSPDNPVFEGEISWGLVWEGRSSSRRSSDDVDYERYNQPHKLSLYLACSVPVIVWRHAAAAQLVERERCGILVEGLEDIAFELEKYSSAEIQEFRQNAVRLSKLVRSGHFIKKAIKIADTLQ